MAREPYSLAGIDMKMPKAILKSCYSFIQIHKALNAHGIKPDNDTVFGIMEHAANTPQGGSCAFGFQADEAEAYEEDVIGMRKQKK